MTIGDFNDFLATLTPEVVEQIADDANEKAEQIRHNSEIGSGTFLGNQIGIISYTFSLELLGLYHKWLEQQL